MLAKKEKVRIGTPNSRLEIKIFFASKISISVVLSMQAKKNNN
jgi:hypothetical protein